MIPAMRAGALIASLALASCRSCSLPGKKIAPGPKQTAAGMSFAAPADWALQPPRAMRVGTYRIPAAQGDPEDAELGVFYFGPGQGGGVDANIDRWFNQFVQPDGRQSQAVAHKDARTINGFPVTTVDLSGTYLFSPTPMSPEKTPKPNFRLLGAIVQAPEGNVFFKLTGPQKTVATAAAGFEALLASLSAG